MIPRWSKILVENRDIFIPPCIRRPPSRLVWKN